ncbi:MAG: hypothetical protein HY270_21685 [Deltaproteobacteria bacterium]|nr:hypothetical protein [Deltaproteobacteria bacterium]
MRFVNQWSVEIETVEGRGPRICRSARMFVLSAIILTCVVLPRGLWAASGNLDVTFGNNGTITNAGTLNWSNQTVDLATQPDGKLIAAGYAFVSSSFSYDFAVARYNPDGSFDATFGSGGQTTTNLGGDDLAYALTLQSDGKIVVVGRSGGSPTKTAIARYNPDGSLDGGFGTGGKVRTAIGSNNSAAYAVAVQSDGKILVAGYVSASPTSIAVLRYNSDGSLDAGFGSGGQVITPVGPGNSSAYTLALQSDQKIVVACSASNGSNLDVAVLRYNTDGSLDGGFGTGGVATTPIGTGDDQANAVALQGDGKIVVAASVVSGSNYYYGLARYNTDGSLDAGFGTGGTVTTTVGAAFNTNIPNAVGLQSDGKIVLAGEAWTSSPLQPNFAMVRYNTDGSVDTSFGTAGEVTTAIGSGGSIADSMNIEADGRIVLAGFDDSPGVTLARYLAFGCGDGVIEGGEQCDDGNVINGDCCASDCQSSATNGTPCNDGLFCNGADTCNAGSCSTHGGDPCAGGGECNNLCNETADNCAVASGTSCTEDGIPCTLDQCNGAGVCAHPAGHIGTVCRPGAGVCDVPESCDGVNVNCPSDTFQSSATVCRAAAGVCDVAENCTGSSAACPSDTLLPSTTTCRASAGACDVTENCTGADAACPADAFQPSTMTCRASVSDCDPAETCTGSAAACPPDGTHGVNATKPKVTLTKQTTPPGDDGLTFKGEYVLAANVLSSLDPVSGGAHVQIHDSTNATLVDATLPPGAYDTISKTGWKVSKTGRKWTYVNPSGVQGITKLVVTNKDNSKTPGRVTFSVTGTRGNFAVNPSHIPVSASLSFNVNAGDCALSTFPGPAPTPACSFIRNGSTLKCK